MFQFQTQISPAGGGKYTKCVDGRDSYLDPTATIWHRAGLRRRKAEKGEQEWEKEVEGGSHQVYKQTPKVWTPTQLFNCKDD